jgi:hypothetical protein
MMSRVAAGESTIAKVSNFSNAAANWMFKANGQNWWTRQRKGDAATGWLAALPKLAAKNWAELEPSFQQALTSGGLTRTDWVFLRSNMETLAPDVARSKAGAYKFFDSRRFADIPDDAIANKLGGAATRRTIEAERKRLQDASDAAMKAFVDTAVPTPGNRERAVTRLGVRANESPLAYALISSINNLIGYPTTYMMRVMRAEMRSGNPVSGMLMLSASALFYGTISQILVDLANSRTRDWLSDDPEIMATNVLDAAARGGLGGYAGSMLIDSVRYGSSPTDVVKGAPLSVLDRFMGSTIKIGNGLIEGDIDAAGAALLKEFDRSAGVTKLPYVRPLWENLFYRQWLDMLDPAAVYDTDRRFERRTGGSRIFEVE